MNEFAIFCIVVGLGTIIGGRYLARIATPPDKFFCSNQDDDPGFEVSGQNQAHLFGVLLILTGALIMSTGVLVAVL